MSTQIMLAWHGRAELKAEVVARMRAHRAADDLIQGDYQLPSEASPLGYRGCALGCTLPYIGRALAYRYCEEIERQYGIDWRVADLIDDIFEGLDEGYGDFAVAVLEAIPVGADLQRIGDQIEDWGNGEDEPEIFGACEFRDWLLGQVANAPVPAAVSA